MCIDFDVRIMRRSSEAHFGPIALRRFCFSGFTKKSGIGFWRLADKIVNAVLKASPHNSSRLRLGRDFRMVKANLRPNQNL